MKIIFFAFMFACVATFAMVCSPELGALSRALAGVAFFAFALGAFNSFKMAGMR